MWYLTLAISWIEKNGRGQWKFYATHYVRILRYATLKAKCDFFMIFFCFVDSKLILSERSLISNFKYDLINLDVVIRCSVNYATEGNPTKIPSKCLQKYLDFFSFLFFFFDRVGNKCLCRQDLTSCVDSSMLLFENSRELSFQSKSVNLCSANYVK